MWEGLLMLLVLSGIMAMASFLAGSLPLSFSLSQRQMRLISAMGTGLLIGTALIVIIPEGIETLYSASSVSTHSVASAEAPVRGGVAPLALHQIPKEAVVATDGQFVQYDTSQIKGTDRLRPGEEEPNSPAPKHGRVRRAEPDEDHNHAESSSSSSSHAWIGISLISGFVLMYLIDIIPSIAAQSTSRSQSNGQTHHIPLSTLDPESSPSPTILTPPSSNRPNPTTIGLLIHALADGIALGASSTPSTSSSKPQTTLSLVIFIAILVHKAPAAFGLTSLLLNQGISKRSARTHLLLFSFAAPVGALVTWTLIRLLGKSGQNLGWWTGIALIFSGGTFLYVALHAMQTISSSGHSHHHVSVATSTSMGNEYGAFPSGEVPQGKSRTEVGLVVTGMLLPLLTQIGHAHAHG